MLQALSKKNNQSDERLVQRVARESRIETLARLHASAEGLSTKQATLNRKEYGSNEIASRRNLSKLRFFWQSFLVPGFLALFLVVASLILINYFNLKLSNLVTLFSLTLLILLIGAVSFFQKSHTFQVLEQLLKMVSVTTNIRRDGHDQELPTNQVVVGDIINLTAGDMVPADMRLLRSKDLFCSTSSITGKFRPTEKIASQIPRRAQINNYLSYPDVLYEGMTVVSGAGRGVVFATGQHTLFGKIVQNATRNQLHRNSFTLGTQQLVNILTVISVLAAGLFFLINDLSKGDPESAFTFAIVAALSFSPRLLPLVAGVNLLNGSKKMANHHVVVKRLNALQSFSAADVVCIDKTGYLTQNKIALERHYDLNLKETKRVLKLTYLNSYYQTGLKDLIDKAVIEAAGDELNINEIQRDYHKIDEVPFDYTRRRMSVVVANSDRLHGEHLLVTKGSPEQMLAVATKLELNKQVVPLTQARKQKLTRQIEEMNNDGLRVLLLGYKRNPAPVGEFSIDDEKDLTLAGFLTFLDPIKESARQALTRLHRDGVTVKILTGDNAAVTRSLGLQVGLNVDTVYRAEDLNDQKPAQLRKMVEKSNFFVEMTPALKTRIIRALQKNGHVVGYLGDKINDAPAMRLADVSLSIDHAVDMAKEAADIILMHKNLTALEWSIHQSRSAFDNIVQYFKLCLASDCNNFLILLIACLVLPFLPLQPFQLLIFNLLIILSCLGLNFTQSVKNILKKPQALNLKAFFSVLTRFLPITVGFNLLGLFLLVRLINPSLKLGLVSVFRSGWLANGLYLQAAAIFLLGSRGWSMLKQRPKIVIWGDLLLLLFIASILAFSRWGQYLGFVPLPTTYFGVLILLLTLYLLVGWASKKLHLNHFPKSKS